MFEDDVPPASLTPEEPGQASEQSDHLPLLVSSKLAGLPARPGCYLFRDRSGGVLYVGKAKSLRSRVRSYFADSSGDARAFIPWLRRGIGDLETVVTATEKEAAVLENHLIKELRPRYNVKLRDDKEYLSLRFDLRQEFPRLELVRRPPDDGARTFGPYPSATAARRTLHLVERNFQLRTCTDREFAQRRRPCIQYQIQRCLAPCVLEVDRDAYAAQVRAVGLFLEGRHDEVTRLLQERMKEASRLLDFELAARLRDQLSAVTVIHEQQRVVMQSDDNLDVLGLYREGELVELVVMLVRGGRVIELSSYSHLRTELDNAEVVAAFLRDYYGPTGPGAPQNPDEILLPLLPDAADGVEDWLADERQRLGRRGRCRLAVPQRGVKMDLLRLASENAQHAFAEKARAKDDLTARLVKLQQKLRLPELPRRIECIDISHLGGQDTVGAIVALLDGRPDKSRYRSYKLRQVSGGDDYGAMAEVLARRFRRGAEAGDEPGDWDLPQLFVVDGGRGQLAVALAAARELGLESLPIVGLAKEKENVAGEKLVDRVYVPGQKNPISLKGNSPELYLLAMARDEAHRFSNRGRRKLGDKRRFTSRLEEVPGIGPRTAKALLLAFPSIDAIAAARDEALLAVKGVSQGLLPGLRQHLAEADGEPLAEEEFSAEQAPGRDVTP